MHTKNPPERADIPGECLLKITQVAKRLNVSERHVRNLMERKLIAYVRLGGALRFDPDEVDAAKVRMTVAAR